jgi:hypothetical protein
MPGALELTLDFSVIDDDHFGFVLQSLNGHFEGRLSRQFSSGVREDIRLLRWKAIGLHNPGDLLLIEIGVRISKLIFVPEREKEWTDIVPAQPALLRIRFAEGTAELLNLPWELLRIGDRFVLARAGRTYRERIARKRGPRSRF